MSVIQLGDIPIEKTSEVGSPSAGTPFDIKTPTGRPVSWIKACWDGEVIKGLAIKFHGAAGMYTVADWDNTHERFHNSFHEFAKDDILKQAKASTSYFGYGSVRGIFLQTRAMPEMWSAGNITDTPSEFNVEGRYFMGIFGSANRDNFINSFGLWVSAK